MQWYRNYGELIQSSLLDTFVLRRGFPFFMVIWHWYYLDHLWFPVPPLILYLSIGRPGRALALLVAWWSQIYFWVGLVLTTELLRFSLMYGLPWLLRRIGQQLPSDPVGETAIKRLIRRVNLVDCLLIYQQYQMQDDSEPLSPTERAAVQRCFTEFDRTSFVFDRGLIVFLPSFMIRIQDSGIQLTDAMKVVQPSSDDTCPICREQPSPPWIELNCNHRYCLGCILNWLQRKMDCPLCRRSVS